MKPGTTLRRTGTNRKRLMIACVFAAAALGMIPAGITGGTGSVAPDSAGLLAPRLAHAQNFGHRVIQGVVMDGDKPMAGATIFLKNLKSRDLKSYTSIADGSFRFAQVGMIDDYEVWAEQGKKKSPVRSISSFDSRKLVEFDLKLK